MKKVLILALALPLLLTGCRRNSYDMWEDTKTASRHMARGARSMGGKQGDSRQVRSRSEFICQNDYEDEFHAFYDTPARKPPMVEERGVASARQGAERNREAPGIASFRSPNDRSDTAHIFQNIHFPYNSSLIKGKDNLVKIRRISEYLIAHPSVSIFVEGHCDQRGPEAYNLALGTRRSNAVRDLLIKEGVNPDQLFTVSYGKERPVNLANNEDAWAENRRGEFKLYHKEKGMS